MQNNDLILTIPRGCLCATCLEPVKPNTLYRSNGNLFCDEDCKEAYDLDVETMKAEDMRAEADYEDYEMEVEDEDY